jgi:hypothetical protein
MMKHSTVLLLQMIMLVLASTITATTAFVPSHNTQSAHLQQRQQMQEPSLFPSTTPTRTKAMKLYMGGKMSKFGVFSPAVYVAKFALGTDRLNKVRGKAISLHSQYIGDFCEWIGAYHLRTQLIKKAKTNGDILGFLV